MKVETEQTEQGGRAPIPYPSFSTLSAHMQGTPLCFMSSPRHVDPSTNVPNLVRLLSVLGPPLCPQLAPAETRRRLSLLHTCVSPCVLLTALVTRTHVTSEVGMASWSPGGQSLAQLRDLKWAMTIVSREIAARVGSGC